ncbi:RHS repeat-associated core domain-containing protein [Cellulomonas sp. KRMCY2]|uniref:RHS repeat-associated core domain-containing protein n=1 Tax=Cellulomonas sp. KRMCY2 TaxID=1304865 RepID=UPI00045E9BCA|nr:RHS repeat-associated core domain-containing protein [Cellulomonas sp. KRMCY2]
MRCGTCKTATHLPGALRSPAALLTSFDTSAFQYSFDPYGVATLEQSSGGNAVAQTPFLYTGGLHDRTTGWIKNGARYYTPGEGRWTQHDTLDAPLDPNNANRYAYAGCNPINYTDPTGENACSLAATIAGVVHTTIWATAASAAFTGGTSLAVGAGVSLVLGVFWGAISEFGCN